MAPPASEAPKSAAQKAAERLAEENADMKREAVEQDERLKRLHAKIQKMEQDMAGLLRKRGTVGQGATASAAARGGARRGNGKASGRDPRQAVPH